MSRLLAGSAGPDLDLHVERHGPVPLLGAVRPGRLGRLAGQVAEAGLRGRGGGWFPTARKLAAVAGHARGRPPVVVVNAMESEPLSAKDAHLLAVAPHLVLDGASLAAETIGAGRVVLAVRADGRALNLLAAERFRRGADPVRIEVHQGPDRFLAGQESALAGWIDGGPALPTTRRPYERGVDGRATFVGNAETLAHLALIARRGPAWFRSAGTTEAPGTLLVSVSGPGVRVREVPVGTPVGEVAEPGAAVLLGGYGGAWLPGDRAGALPLAPEPLRAAGATLGAGIVSVLPYGTCGLAHTASIVRWLASQGARQCGPCLFGLPALARDLSGLAAGTAGGTVVDRLRGRAAVIPGRGACAHPDGVSRLVTSALQVFADEVEAHLGSRCRAATETFQKTG
ncbi:NADH-ubiquinone oxidoreductase-F iron-sulfur binding region domain-containing protein [Actinomadura sp. DC4]|uniref:NADH-ubiquinone oxidoreductase-F iron-sulfur binding region domain-containing protein n=1 Tax=Actinomadura sp. DC4 TaxID=3055069 RepID=UPI0025AF9653|nr:NADH-ubiquinone oxidoreductase-F iron-sulfur binding region domain-containing protein [Actinomadura sp. DC4]MDN3354308.1 NADH-ubiquinone oxidoreductase-F iron-sulfur binding region domain-containing protein [Actinomadura sp. DC4]